MKEITEFVAETGSTFREAISKYIHEFERGCGGSHVGIQRGVGGLGIHTAQVIEKALELNQRFDRKEIIETCLAHDLKHWRRLPLKEHQIVAIKATKGLPWKEWRRTAEFRFVALILIADMWSAYVNENNLTQKESND